MYPVTYHADYVEPRNRLSTFLRLIYAIPALIVFTLFSIGAFLASIVAWFAILFTGKYPQGLYDFNAKLVRMAGRVNSYTYLVMIMNYVWALIGEVVAFLAWFAIVFTGKMPHGLFDPIRNSMRFNTQTTAYFLLLTEDWPHFSEEPAPEPATPAGSLQSGVQAGVQAAAGKVSDAAEVVRDKAQEIAERTKPPEEK
jgi:hypothetical protein